jgi:hypothetical protein
MMMVKAGSKDLPYQTEKEELSVSEVRLLAMFGNRLCFFGGTFMYRRRVLDILLLGVVLLGFTACASRKANFPKPDGTPMPAVQGPDFVDVLQMLPGRPLNNCDYTFCKPDPLCPNGRLRFCVKTIKDKISEITPTSQCCETECTPCQSHITVEWTKTCTYDDGPEITTTCSRHGRFRLR